MLKFTEHLRTIFCRCSQKQSAITNCKKPIYLENYPVIRLTLCICKRHNQKQLQSRDGKKMNREVNEAQMEVACHDVDRCNQHVGMHTKIERRNGRRRLEENAQSGSGRHLSFQPKEVFSLASFQRTYNGLSSVEQSHLIYLDSRLHKVVMFRAIS